MEFALLGFLTGLSLILAIGAQNIFVIEQGLKKQQIFLVCLICSLSDFILIFLGIFLFHYFNQYFTPTIELVLNILLIIFLIHFIYSKIKSFNTQVNLEKKSNFNEKKDVILKTLGFTFLNPHVYSDTVFFLGNFSKNFFIIEKYSFGIGATIASFLFFFSIGYLSQYFARYLNDKELWKYINIFIILFMFLIALYILGEIFKFF
ncbi:LysE/ArgO family amino acid transporter [Candidatus Pelagibacter sp.]|uniref:LysE/ArgO family amino acid transporter n=1 Tax=Candidatus Pelagibacter sp. TaxID=2024849 RepID=UPI003F83365E